MTEFKETKMTEFKIALGATVESDLSGFTGVVTLRSESISGLKSYWVAPRVGTDGKLPDGLWIDEPELRVISEWTCW